MNDEAATLGPARALSVLVLALSVRVAVQVEMWGADPFFAHPRADSVIYLRWARDIARGNLMGDGPFFQAPLYPYLLAPLVGAEGPWPTQMLGLLHAGIDAASALLVALLATRLLSNRATGILAGLLYAVGREPVFYSSKVLTTAPLTCLLLLGALLSLYRQRSRLLAAGVALGFACLAWPGALLAVAGLAAMVWWRSRRLAFASLLLAGAGACILPVTLRNLAFEPSLVLVSWNGGFTLLQGNNERAQGNGSPYIGGSDLALLPHNAKAMAEKIAGRALTCGEAASVLAAKARGWILEHPGDALRLLGRKALLIVSGRESEEIYSLPFERVRFVPSLGRLPVTFTLLSVALPAGLVLLGRDDLRRLLPTFVLAGAIVATLLIVFTTTRYKMPLFPLGCIWLAAGLRRLARSPRRRMALALVAMVPTSVLAWSEASRQPIHLSLYTDLSDIRLSEGDLPAAYLEVELARELRPDFGPAVTRKRRLESIAGSAPVSTLLLPVAGLGLPSPGQVAAAAALLERRGEGTLARRLARLALAIGGREKTTLRLAREVLDGARPAGPPADPPAASPSGGTGSL